MRLFLSIFTCSICFHLFAQVGDVDLTFNAGGLGPNDGIDEIVRLPDGKYLIRGEFTQYNGQSANQVARLNSDGSLDSTFNAGSGPDGDILCFDVYADGSVMLGGSFSTFNGWSRSRMVRLLPDGSVDASFNANNTIANLGSGAWAQISIQALAIDPNCRVVFCDNVAFTQNAAYKNVNRVDESGALDPTFNAVRTSNTVGGLGIYSPEIIKVRPDGRILITGFFGAVNNVSRLRFAILEPNGVLSNLGDTIGDAARSLTVFPDNSTLLVILGGSTAADVYKILPNGTLDTAFNPGFADHTCQSAELMPDGRVIVVGSFDNFNGVHAPGIVRLYPNGAVDTTFVPTHNGPDIWYPSDVAIDLHRRPILVGNFGDYGGTSIDRIVRLQECPIGTTCLPDSAPECSDYFHCACYIPPDPFTLSPFAMLEGPKIPGQFQMSEVLRTTGQLPLSEPYTALPGFTHVGNGGGETTTAAILATERVVDWVFIELRDPTDPSIVLQTRSALVLFNGTIINVDGSTTLQFDGELAGDAYVAIRHRNHLGIMTQTPYPLTPGSHTTLDFRFGNVPAWGTEAMVHLLPLWYMWAGDVNGDGELRYTGSNNDRDEILVEIGGSVPTNTTSGYLTEDVNLDGEVKYVGNLNDRDPILVNIGGNSPTAVRSEQLP